MNIKNHPDYWATHKKVYQQESDSLDPIFREIVFTSPSSTEAKLFNRKVESVIKRKLVSSPVE